MSAAPPGRAASPPGLDLRLREAEGEPQGALILNHGRGADEYDLYPLLDEVDPGRRLLGVTTGAPIRDLPPGGRHWYVVERVGFPHAETFSRALRMLGAGLDGLLAERAIPWSRTALGGFSQGAVMSYALALSPGRPAPAALLALSGFIPSVEGWEPETEGRASIAALVYHGANDPVIPVDFGRSAEQRLRAAGIPTEYHEAAAAHGISAQLLPALRAHLERAIPPAE